MVDPKIRNKYTPTIGIECHVQLKTITKLFAGVGNDAREAPPNTLVSHICFGLPGSLPVLNEQAIYLAAKAAFALGTKPEKFSQFDRKHYFYPDLPKGYQITQYAHPIVGNGSVTINVSGEQKTIGITRAHLEEDAGKNTHPAGADYSLVDLNRAGTPLLEIVSEPDMHTASEAKAYAHELFLRMRYAGVSDANLYYGNMRFDVNVSVSSDPNQLGTRSETKNLNSFRSVEKAVDYEVNRQIELLEKGEKIVQETRGWDDAKQRTFSQRSKEDVHDYRYFPDPDLPPVLLEDAFIATIQSAMPLLPTDIRTRLAEAGISGLDIETLLDADSAAAGTGYIAVLLAIEESSVVKFAANWMINRQLVALQKQTSESGETVEASSVTLPTAADFAAVYQIQVVDKKMSSNNGDALLTELSLNHKGENPQKLADALGYLQVSDESALLTIVDQVLRDNQQAANDVKNGETKAIGFLVGQVMKASKGKADPSVSQELIRRQLGL